MYQVLGMAFTLPIQECRHTLRLLSAISGNFGDHLFELTGDWRVLHEEPVQVVQSLPAGFVLADVCDDAC